MRDIHIRGMGLSCALGLDLASCAAGLQAGVVPTGTVSLDGFGEPVSMPYCRIPDGAALLDPSRFRDLIAAPVHAALSQARLSREEIAALPLFVGSSSFSISQAESRYQHRLAQQGATAIPMQCIDYQEVASTLQQATGCGGNTYTYNTACTSAANALMEAMQMIRVGWYPHALVVGMELASLTTLLGFSALQIIAAPMRPFDTMRQGTILGEAIGAVLLSGEPGADRRLSLTAAAANCDRYSVTAVNPDGSSISSLLTEVLTQAGLRWQAIRGIKAHGTATPANDASEARGIQRVFPAVPPVCALKPYVGHTLGACGVVELALFASALERGFLPMTPGFENVDPALGLSPAVTPTVASDGSYLLNQFGFGGSNTVLILRLRQG